MSEIVDARGLACPQPVILTKKATEKYNEVVVLVDNATAKENVKRFALNSGFSVDIADEPGGIFSLLIKKQEGAVSMDISEKDLSCDMKNIPVSSGPVVLLISSDKMGRGSDELGAVLMKAFLHTLTEQDVKPDIIIFYNSGVMLAAEDSDALHDLKKFEDSGIKILVCGTCVNYFNLTGRVAAGVVSNMYDIASTLFKAGKIVKP